MYGEKRFDLAHACFWPKSQSSGRLKHLARDRGDCRKKGKFITMILAGKLFLKKIK